MASINYAVVPLDLAIVRTALGLLPTGVRYDSLTVLSIPAGAVCSVAFGTNKPFVPLTASGQAFRFLDQCERPLLIDEGLFVSNPLGAGIVTLLISQGSQS